MVGVDSLKDQLINELWLPRVKEAAAIFYPRRKKNAKMKLFTLTNGINFNEISNFEDEGLIQRHDVIAWVISDFNKRMRLEVESLGDIMEGDITAEPILSTNSQLQGHFPCDIVNLDFSSQEPILRCGRIEQELKCLESHINLQNRKKAKRFVLLYTTIIDQNNVDSSNVAQASDATQVNGWRGLSVNGFSVTISDLNQLKAFIKDIIIKICQKYGYMSTRLSDLMLDIPRCCDQLYSIAAIIER